MSPLPVLLTLLGSAVLFRSDQVLELERFQLNVLAVGGPDTCR